MGEVNWKDSYEAARVELKRAEVWVCSKMLTLCFFLCGTGDIQTAVSLTISILLCADLVEGTTREYEKGTGKAEKVD